MFNYGKEQLPGRRRWGWRAPLLLILSISTWWVVGWAQSPREYVLRYPDRGNISGEYDAVEFRLWPFSQGGNLLLVQRPHCPEHEQVTLEVIELATGKALAQHVMSAKQAFERALYYHLSIQQPGSAHGEVYLKHRLFSNDEHVGMALWRWNIMTDQSEELRRYPPDVELEFSTGGQTLVERTHFSPVFLTGLAPSGLSSALAASLIACHSQYESLGIAIYTIRSLPDLKQRCVIRVPPPLSFSRVELSVDGQWLIFADTTLPGGMLSPFITTYLHRTGNITGGTEFIPSIRAPRELRIYSTMTGELWHKESDYQGYLTTPIEGWRKHLNSLLAISEDPCEMAEDQDAPIAERISKVQKRIMDISNDQNRVFHIPSRKWLAATAYKHFEVSEAQAGDGTDGIRWTMRFMSNQEKWKINQTDRAGITKEVGTIEGGQPVHLLHCSSQALMIGVRSLPIPDWVETLLRRSQKIADWLDEKRYEIVVYDYERQLEVWKRTLGLGDNYDCQLSGDHRFLVIRENENQEHVITVLSLPITYWSPWWGRCAGLLMGVAAYWFLFRRASHTSVLRLDARIVGA